ncbi:MAG TPA: hypothetical protein DEP13_04770 [Gammaproteobacteria bacterium]|nr:hypothetical protein [Gammaproteobacteria bacterium]
MKNIVLGVIALNLLALNVIVYLGYRFIDNGLHSINGKVALQLEQRLDEEYEYITEDIEGVKNDLLESQKQLIPSTAKVRTGLPILP